MFAGDDDVEGGGGLRERFLKTDEVMMPVHLDTGPSVQDCVLLHLRPSGGTSGSGLERVVMQASSKLACEVYDRLRHDGASPAVVERLEALLLRAAIVRSGRETNRSQSNILLLEKLTTCQHSAEIGP